jgi:hypothetical protein
MKRRSARTIAVVGAAALCLSLLTAGAVIGKKKVRHIGTSTQVESSTHGKRNITVTGVIQSSVPKCERDRSVLLYQDGPGAGFIGGAIGHAVSEGGSSRGQFEIAGVAPKKILPSRLFRLEAVGRTVVVKGQTMVCKRGVSVQFPGTFGG